MYMLSFSCHPRQVLQGSNVHIGVLIFFLSLDVQVESIENTREELSTLYIKKKKNI